MTSRKTTTKRLEGLTTKLDARAAGVLLHITSLPSLFGIGDLGPEATRFADFLSRSGQRYWQMLPLNPTGPAQLYSPYSSTSSMAGNILLISPEQLVTDGLLNRREIKNFITAPTSKVEFKKADTIRKQLLPLAYQQFKSDKRSQVLYNEFWKKHQYWLPDYALYSVLKEKHKDSPWYQWPANFRKRNAQALQQFSDDNAEAIRFQGWLQYIFFRQWSRLKKYCNDRGIKMYGDIPFYVSYDSADVWSHPELFSIDSNGKMKGVAGVPPDYFNENGQLWGMPTFRWDVLKNTRYKWWIERIKANIELFDVLRLDHFRAFADYWEVPASHKNAKKGKWKPGPGHDFFINIGKAIGKLPFIAEDLGDINDAVYKLRDDFRMPGMKVLQFAFGDALSTSGYIPHNYSENFVVYTGTHDNNTTRGWFRKDIREKERKQIAVYSGNPVNERNVSEVLARMAYASTARIAILPLQDILALNESARMNTPASVTNNWLWRFKPGTLTNKTEKKLKEWVWMFGRK